jgi:hypothetical protein
MTEGNKLTVDYDSDADRGEIAYPSGVQITVQFQHGPIGENGVNGVQNEEIINLLSLRLRALNARFPCRENSIAITKLDEALLWLEHRTAIRREQGVEGQNLVHVS